MQSVSCCGGRLAGVDGVMPACKSHPFQEQARKGPALADNKAVEGMTIIYTETRASVLLCDKSTRGTPRARSPLP